MRLLRVVLLPALVFCQFNAFALAQYMAKQINFKGSTPYAEADLQAACGMHPGLTFGQPELQAAAQRLVDTGAFDDVQVKLDGPVKAISVNFSLKAADPSRMLRVSFENFVWWQPGELQSALHAKVPLFEDALPESGNEQDAMTAALKELLSEKGVTGTVSSKVIEPTLSHPRMVEYKVSSPSVNLHVLHVGGASTEFAPELTKIARSNAGGAYDEGATNRSVMEQILNVYRDAGHLTAAFTEVKRTPLAAQADRIDVDLSLDVKEDQPYRLSKIDYAGAPLFSSADFVKSLTFHPEDIASRKVLLASLQPIYDTYQDAGYLDVAVNATPTFDGDTHHVAYVVSVMPGEQYRIRNLEVLNLSPVQRAEFDSAWRLKPGELYNAGYITHFLKNNTALRSLNGYSASFQLASDPDSHLADLTINFAKGVGATNR
jgi:outer membrane protein insertion porin family